MSLTPTQWIVLDNLKNGWDYSINLHQQAADEAYQWCIGFDYVRHGKITDVGAARLACSPNPKPERDKDTWNTRYVKTGKFYVVRKGKLMVVDKLKPLERYEEEYRGEIQIGNEWIDVSKAERE